MQALAAMAEEAAAAAAMTYSQAPLQPEQTGNFSGLLAENWLQSIPGQDIQQLLSQLPPAEYSPAR